jgi:hypothetical protein
VCPLKAIEQLAHHYLLLKAGAGDMDACIDWAIERLRHDEEGDDLDIVLLAGATEANEAAPLVRQIVERYCGADIRDDELAAGKYVAHLRKSYLLGAETIASLDLKLTGLYRRLDYPDWLGMLTRNCEYATDIPVFEESFEKEFAYLAGLWESAMSRAEFESLYRREISAQHDLQNG